MKLVFFVGFCCCFASAAHASYDLLMVPDDVSKGIARLDPEAQMSLGSFARSETARTIHSVNKGATAGTVLATGNFSTFWDYSTGHSQGNSSTPYGITLGNSAGTRFVEAYGSYLYGYGAAANYVYGYNTGLAALYVGAPLSTSSFFAFGADASGNFVAHTRVGSTNVTSILNAGAASMVIGTPMVVDDVTSSLVYLPVKRADGFNYVHSYFVNLTTGVAQLFSAYVVTGFSTSACMTIVPSHYGYYVIGRDSTNSSLTRITSYTSFFGQIGSYTTSAVQVPTSRWVGAIVLAPEPASYAAFLVGGFALLRRRRR